MGKRRRNENIQDGSCTRKPLAWLDVGQTAAKATIMTALKVLREGKQEDLVDRLAKRDKKCQQSRILGNEQLDEESMEHKGTQVVKIDAT